MVSFWGMLARSVSTNNVQMKIVRSTIAAMRNAFEISEAGNFALEGFSRFAILLAPPGSHGTYPYNSESLRLLTVTPIIDSSSRVYIFFVFRSADLIGADAPIECNLASPIIAGDQRSRRNVVPLIPIIGFAGPPRPDSAEAGELSLAPAILPWREMIPPASGRKFCRATSGV
jgi:hypothetical protein